ncbi:MAG: galactose-1-phosphate uridylyltransferase [Calditrichaeota bacterium]|nr:galactose-1-phosphate uridylyltransferase [Calditrichota bacterium]
MPDFDQPHRRFNPLTGEWVLVFPHRIKRPWHGKTEETDPQKRPSYLPDCYLCPGNKRANGEINPDYRFTYVFNNDFAALLPGQESRQFQEHDFLKAESVDGTCRVLCFSPRHDLTLAEAQRDFTAEQAARRLQTLSDMHFGAEVF